MPGYLLNTSSTVMCAHGGQAKLVPNPRVKVAGAPTVLQPVPAVVTGCANPVPPANLGPCVTGMWLTGSLRVKSMGQPLLLQDSQSLCTPTPSPLSIAATQQKVKGM